MKKVLLFSLIFASCGTAKKTSILSYATPLPEGAKVEILGKGQIVPEGAKLLGEIKIGDNGLTTKCDYATVINDATTQARGMGGNILFITEHKEPNMLTSTCHRIKANVYLK